MVRIAQQPCYGHATTVTSMLRGGLCRRPAAMRDQSGTMSVAVMMLRVLVLLLIVTVVCMAVLS